MNFFSCVGLFTLICLFLAAASSRPQSAKAAPQIKSAKSDAQDRACEVVIDAEIVEEEQPVALVHVPNLSVPAAPKGGAWACCYLRLLGEEAQLAGVPTTAAEGCVKRLESLGAESVYVISMGSGPLVVVAFQASPAVLVQLSQSFPSACGV